MTLETLDNLTPEALLKTVLVAHHGYAQDGPWKYAFQEPAGDWKVHVYADSPEDWTRVAQVILPYFHRYKVFHKTFRDLEILEAVTQNPVQRGKAFTIYAQSANVLKQIVLDLDSLLVAEDLTRTDVPVIFGDQPIGSSHRLFYRYDKDLNGNYRENDGMYRPEEVPDPFKYFAIEALIATQNEGNSMILGREGEGNGLWPSTVSPMHARLIATITGWEVEDLDSLCGTFVNGFRISKPTPLKPNDILHLGPLVPLLMLHPREPIS